MDRRQFWQDEYADDAPDDLDRVMARLTPPVAPRSLVASVLAETTRREQPAWQPMWQVLWLAYGVLLLLVGCGAVLFGQALHGTGTLDYLSFAASDSDLVLHDPGLFQQAVFEHMPWGHLVALVVVLAVWACVTIALLRRLDLGRAPRMMAGAAR